MSKNKDKKSRDSSEKLELAQRIAATTPRLTKTYASVENAFIYIARSFSGLFNKVIVSPRISRIFALALAIIMYFTVNASENSSIGVTQSATINNIPVSVVYNSEMYEVSGIPETVNVIVRGDMSNITLQKSQTNSNVICDLSGLTEGNYSIKLVPNNFNSQLEVNIIDTPSANVTIKKKITSKFNVSYEFINVNAMDSRYSLSEPVFDTTEVLIRASESTISNISFVKAYIDVSERTEPFTTEAKVVAYNNDGMMVECDIIPSTITASVNVIQLSKEVPIIVRPVGRIAEGYAIDSISLDYSTVTLYAPQSVLNMIDAVYIDVDISAINSAETVMATNLNTPSGINSMSVTRVNMEIIMGQRVSKTIHDVKVSWTNYNAAYKFKVVNSEDALMDVVIYGTQKNVDQAVADDITVNIDLNGLTVGTQHAPLSVSGTNVYLNYEIASGKQYVEVEITE